MKCVSKMLIFLGLILTTLTFSQSSKAAFTDSSSAYGPQSKRFGLGVYVGEPTGLTLKGYLTERAAIDGIAAWSFKHETVTLIGDLNYEIFDIPVSSSVISLPFYLGVGGKLELNSGRNDEIEVGVRVPIGVAVQWNTAPIEVFLEVVPCLELVQETDFDLMGGLGIRFYF